MTTKQIIEELQKLPQRELGMTVNTAINVFVRESVRNQRLNLNLSVIPGQNRPVSREEAKAIAERIVMKGGTPVPADVRGTEIRIADKYGL